jgi:cyclopropane-fatty-acyl-phospholipid synthase
MAFEQLYQPYTEIDEQRRTNRHYNQPSEFFVTLTGGDWNLYSCNLWAAGATIAESQEAKLQVFATQLGLAPGKRLLDVGCGWGGALCYLCSRFGVSGTGITLSPNQQATVAARIAKERVSAEVVIIHWRNFINTTCYDAIMSDEVLVHIYDLREFFLKMRALLQPRGRLLNKELHLIRPEAAAIVSRGADLMNRIFGCTGNYRTLAEEVRTLENTGFRILDILTFEPLHYVKTIDHWIDNFRRNETRLIAITGNSWCTEFLRYLKIARKFVSSGELTIDTIVAEKQ